MVRDRLRARAGVTQALTIPALLPPGRTDADAPRMAAVPALGGHTEAILQELGWTRARPSRGCAPRARSDARPRCSAPRVDRAAVGATALQCPRRGRMNAA